VAAGGVDDRGPGVGADLQVIQVGVAVDQDRGDRLIRRLARLRAGGQDFAASLELTDGDGAARGKQHLGARGEGFPAAGRSGVLARATAAFGTCFCGKGPGLPLSKSISKHDRHALRKLGRLHEHLDRHVTGAPRLDLEDLPGERAAHDDTTGHH
jgi:hypothetical protein